MGETTEHEQIEPAESPAAPPADKDAPADTTRFDPWVGIAYHAIQVVFVVAAIIIAIAQNRDFVTILSGEGRVQFLFTLGLIGVPAIGMAIALRLGQLDLSVGAMATFAMAVYAANDGGSPAQLTAIGTAIAIGAVTGAVSGALRIPAWLSTLALSFVLVARFFDLVGPTPVPFGGDAPPAGTTPGLSVMFFVLGIAAAGVFLVLDVLRRPGQVKRIEELSLAPRILLPAAALAITAGFAAYTGIMQAERVRLVAAPGLQTVLPAILAAVLIGGVGVFGGRVSLIGTMLGALGLTIIEFGIVLAGESDPQVRMYISAIPLAIFLVLRGVAAVVRNERIPA